MYGFEAQTGLSAALGLTIDSSTNLPIAAFIFAPSGPEKSRLFSDLLQDSTSARVRSNSLKYLLLVASLVLAKFIKNFLPYG